MKKARAENFITRFARVYTPALSATELWRWHSCRPSFCC